jgi:hypothetical protein
MWQSISTFVFRLFLIHPCDSRNPRLNFRSQRRALRGARTKAQPFPSPTWERGAWGADRGSNEFCFAGLGANRYDLKDAASPNPEVNHVFALRGSRPGPEWK